MSSLIATMAISRSSSVEKGLGATVVKSLTLELHMKHHHIFFDNYFINISLLEDLLEDGYICLWYSKEGSQRLTR